MRSIPTRGANLASLSCGGDDDQDRQEVPKHQDSNKCDIEEDEESPSGTNKDKEENKVVTVMLGRCAPAPKSLPLIIIKEMEEMFLRLGFSETVAQKLAKDQGIDSPCALANLSNEDSTAICDIIRRPGYLVGWKTQDKWDQISILVAKNLKVTAFMFKSMEHWPKTYNNRYADYASVLQHQHQWEWEQKNTDDLNVLKTGQF